MAERAGTSPALVIYYFKTKDQLLTEAIRQYEDTWYAVGQRRMAEPPDRQRADRGDRRDEHACRRPTRSRAAAGSCGWTSGPRRPATTAVATVRRKSDERWRDEIARLVLAGQEAGEFADVDAGGFAVTLSALLDGLTIQIALEDPVVDPVGAFELSMQFVADRLGFAWTPGRGATA